MVSPGKPFTHFYEADAILRHYGAFTVGWAAEMLQDDALAERLVNAVGFASRDQKLEAARQWQVAMAALREWHAYGAGAGFVSFMFAIYAFYGALLAHDTVLQLRLSHAFLGECEALFPANRQLPLLTFTPSQEQPHA